MTDYNREEQALLAKIAKARYLHSRARREAQDAFDIACSQALAEYIKAREGAQL